MKKSLYCMLPIMLTAMPAVADDTDSSYHGYEEGMEDIAILFAECGGRYEAKAEFLQNTGDNLAAETASMNARDFELASQVAFSRLYDQEGEGPLDTWRDLPKPYAARARDVITNIFENTPPPGISKVIDDALVPCSVARKLQVELIISP